VSIRKTIVCFYFALICWLLAVNESSAHNIFKKEMDALLPGMKIDCNACHIDKKPKTERNPLGKLFQKELEAEELTKNWKTKKGSDKKDYEEKVMVPSFKKAAEKVFAMTLEDVIKAGGIEGIKGGQVSHLDEMVSIPVQASNSVRSISLKASPAILMFVSTASPARESVADRMYRQAHRKYFGRFESS
jgi:hypothetical protein